HGRLSARTLGARGWRAAVIRARLRSAAVSDRAHVVCGAEGLSCGMRALLLHSLSSLPRSDFNFVIAIMNFTTTAATHEFH
ncbi:hypothetical protein EVAR_68385_1, partial [Eumeta japonica]